LGRRLLIEMRDALPEGVDGSARSGLACECCGRVVVTSVEGVFSNPAVGSVQRFCSAACRQAAYRRRLGGVAEDLPRQLTAGRGRRLNGPDRLAGRGNRVGRK
jgi:hypothetical protein